MEIRRIKADEWQIFKSVRLAALKNDGDQFGQSYNVLKEYNDERWKTDTEKGAESDELFLIFAVDDTKPVGMSACFRTKDFGKIFAVWVEPSYRGKGIGGLLVAKTMEVSGCDKFKLSFIDGNTPAIKTYKNLGSVRRRQLPFLGLYV